MSDVSPALTLADLPCPAGLPVLGQVLQLQTTRMHQQIASWSHALGDRFTLKLGPQRALCVTNPQMIQEILRRRPKDFGRYHQMEQAIASLDVKGVFNAEGRPWRRQRRLVNAALHLRHMPAFFPTVHKVAANLWEQWAEAADAGTPVDLLDDLQRYAIDVTTSLSFGVCLDTVRGQASWLRELITPVFPEIMDRSAAVVPTWRIFRTPRQRHIERQVARVYGWLDEVITTTRETLRADPEARASNLLESLILAAEEDDELTDTDIRGNAMTMLLAGEDTTASTIAWAVHELIDAPDARERLVAEAGRLSGDVPRTLDEACGLTWAEAVIKETLRVRPIGPVLFVEPLHDVVVDGLAIPRGTFVMLGMGVAGQSEAYVPDAGVYRPARWLDEAFVQRARKEGLHMPFGSGGRICPGRALALLEAQTVLATLFRSFEVERIGERGDVDEVFGFTMSPQGLKVRLHHRKAPSKPSQARVAVDTLT